MSTIAKRAYYREAGLKDGLAARYFAQFNGARRVLDVGCGTGELGRFSPVGVEVHGVDADPGAVERAQRFERAVCLDLETAPLPYADESFDAVLAKDVLEHLRDPGEVVRELHRVLRPEGVLIASVVMARPRRVWADYTHVRGFTKSSARLLLEDGGFAVEAVWPMGGVPLSNRLRFMGLVPYLLRLPLLSQLFASSWELRARKDGR